MMKIFNRKKTNSALLVITGFMLAACGGGGGGGSESAASGSTQVAGTNTSSVETTSTTETASTTGIVSTAEPATNEVTSTSSDVSSTEDLVVTETFLFSSNYKVRVTANLGSAFDHLTVCYTRAASDEADYDNCLLRADLNDGVFNGELLVTNDTEQLVVSAWNYADAANPAVSYWDRGIDGDLISVN